MLRRQSAQCVKKTGCSNAVWVFWTTVSDKIHRTGKGGGNKILTQVVYCWCSCILDSNQMCDCARVTEEQQARGKMGVEWQWCRRSIFSLTWGGDVCAGEVQWGLQLSSAGLIPVTLNVGSLRGIFLEIVWQYIEGNPHCDLPQRDPDLQLLPLPIISVASRAAWRSRWGLEECQLPWRSSWPSPLSKEGKWVLKLPPFQGWIIICPEGAHKSRSHQTCLEHAVFAAYRIMWLVVSSRSPFPSLQKTGFLYLSANKPSAVYSAVPHCLGGVQERPAIPTPLRELQAGLLWLQELFSLGVSMLCSHAVFLTCYCRAVIVAVEGWEFACCDLFKIFWFWKANQAY